MKVEQNDVLLAVAKLIRNYGITIDEFYSFLGSILKTIVLTLTKKSHS